MMHDFDPCVITELHCKKRDRLKPTSSFDGKKAVDLAIRLDFSQCELRVRNSSSESFFLRLVCDTNHVVPVPRGMMDHPLNQVGGSVPARLSTQHTP